MDLQFLHNLSLGFGVSFEWWNLTWCFGGVLIGTLIGVLPGIGPTATIAMLLPLAAIWMSWFVGQGGASIAAGDAWIATLLIFGGPMTVLPLMFFAIAARRVTLTTLGFMQFLAPTLQFSIGVYYGEPLTTAKLVCFACIWAAVVFFSYDAVKTSQKKGVATK